MPSHLPPRRPARNAAKIRLWAAALLGVVLPALLFCGMAVHTLLQSRGQYDQRAELLSQNLASALDRTLSANVEKIDLALGAVVDHLEQQLSHGRLDLAAAGAHIRSQVAHRTELEGLRVTDTHGMGILGPGLEGRAPLSFADREWFQVQRDRTDAGLHMSQPVVSKVIDQWIVSFSRRYRLPDGSFGGAVSAAVPLSYLTRELQAVDAGAHGEVTLRDASLGLMARHAPARKDELVVVGDRQAAAELQQRLASGLRQGHYAARDGGGSIVASGSFRRLGVAPLVVSVEMAAKDYLADWHGEVRKVLGFGLAVALLYGAASGLMLRSLAQNRKARQRIELLAKVFEHSGEAIMLTDHEHRIIDVNPAFMKQTGYARADVIGQTPAGVLTSSRTTAADVEAIATAVRTQGQWRGEIWDRDSRGREFPKWLSITVLRDVAGQVTHYISSSIDVTEVKKAEARMQHLAHHDTLTQLPNRVYLLARLREAMAEAQRRGGDELAMLFIDMDRFKNINDTLGHQVGDGLLVEVGQRLRTLVRDTDIVARLGGDEFVLVLTGLGDRGSVAAASVARKLVEALGRPYGVQGHELHSTPSIGIAIFPADGEDPDTLMKNADTAMYHAKGAGRNNYQYFTPAMNAARGERLALEVGLRSAIERNQLSLHYQPQVDVASGRVVALEALVRWNHPELGWIPPLKFIPIAEDTGLIESIGAWVLEVALAQVARWRAAGHAQMRVAVNLSSHQLRGEGFASAVAQSLHRHGLPGQALELELTESVAMQDPARTAELLRQLRAFGVALAIDDFGTGYSSLAYLKQLPLSCLKLDRSFVMDIEHDANDAAICTASIQMAHSLGLAVVAEGVETTTQLEFLRRLGCDMVQGYLISKPMPAAESTAFLARLLVPA